MLPLVPYRTTDAPAAPPPRSSSGSRTQRGTIQGLEWVDWEEWPVLEGWGFPQLWFSCNNMLQRWCHEHVGSWQSVGGEWRWGRRRHGAQSGQSLDIPAGCFPLGLQPPDRQPGCTSYSSQQITHLQSHSCLSFVSKHHNVWSHEREKSGQHESISDGQKHAVSFYWVQMELGDLHWDDLRLLVARWKPPTMLWGLPNQPHGGERVGIKAAGSSSKTEKDGH